MKRTIRLLALAFAVILTLSACGSSAEEATTTTTEIVYQDIVTDTQPVADVVESDVYNAESTNAETAAATTQAQTTAAPTEVQTTAAPVYKMPKTDAEIVKYFNEGANKVKTNAVKVTKNYEKRTVGEVVAPQALQSTADKLIKQYMSDDTTATVYSTKEDIRNKFIVPNQDYVSCLTVNDIKDIAIADLGEEYEIQIFLKDESNPVSGSGVGSVCDVIETGDVAGNKMVQSFSTSYYNCVVKARFNKETGNMVWANYTTPLTLEVSVKLGSVHNAKLGITFEKDYVIEY